MTSTGIPVSAVPLPPAHLFDIVPEVHELLSRLLPATANPTDPTVTAYTDQQPLEIQHLANEASAVRIKIQKARAAVKELPDMDRTIEEQEAEMKELEERIGRQRAMLAGLAEKKDGVQQT